jgi:hypothetical protein
MGPPRPDEPVEPARKRHGSLGVLILATLIVFADGAPPSSAAETAYTPVYNPALVVSRAAGPIVIDGTLDDPGWRGAAKADNFAEHQPGDQTQPPVDTEALITYDESHLYVAMICYDDPATVRASFCERDRVFSDDNICLLIDTYADAAWAYEFNVNPYGIQGDLLWVRNVGEDSTYDLIWESAGRITEKGYQVELAIPFASLRFPNQPQQVWKVDFWRNHPRDSRRQYSWAAYDRDEPCWPCQWGTVTGIENVQPGRGIELMPTVVAFQSGSLEGEGTPDDPFDFENDRPSGELSLTAKLMLSSNMTAEATLNPDFSQVEADHAQIDVNSNFALFYQERRPFFQEGSDLFSSFFDAVYTRSINDPQVAAKFTGRRDRLSVAYLVARDEHTPLILPFEESSEFVSAGESTSNVLRARRTFGTDSQVGLIVTDRRLDEGGSGTLLSCDGDLRLSKQYRLSWQGVGTHTQEPNDTTLTADLDADTFARGEHTVAFDGESYTGHALYGELSRGDRAWDARVSYLERSPTFRADNGFEPKNDRRRGTAAAAYLYRLEDHLVEWVQPQVTLVREWNFAGMRKDEWVAVDVSTRLGVAQTNVHVQYMASNENYGGKQFDGIYNMHTCFSTILSDMVAAAGYVNHGRRIARLDVAFGKETTWGLSLDVKPVDRLLVENWFDYATSHDIETGEEFFRGYIARARVSLQVLRRLSVRLVVQYDEFDDVWDVDPLLTYRVNPFSVFYLGSTFDVERYDGLGTNGLGAERRLSSRQFFTKLQYVFQF